MFSTAPSLPECAARLQEKLDNVLAWGSLNGIELEISKTELQYFHRKKGKPFEPNLRADSVEIRPNDQTRWLGVHFDRCLKFRHHIKQACGRATAVTAHIKSLCNTTRGIRPALARQALQGAAFTTLFYWAETWFSANTCKEDIARIQRSVRLSYS